MTAGGADHEMFREGDEFDDDVDIGPGEMEVVAPPRILTVECPRCTFRFTWGVDEPARPGTYRDVVQGGRDILRDVWAAFCSGEQAQWMHAMNKVAQELTEHGPWSPRSPDRIMETYASVCEERRELQINGDRMVKALENATVMMESQDDRIGRLRFWLWLMVSFVIALAVMLAVAVSS